MEIYLKQNSTDSLSLTLQWHDMRHTFNQKVKHLNIIQSITSIYASGIRWDMLLIKRSFI